MKGKAFFVLIAALTCTAALFGQEATAKKPDLKAYFMVQPLHGVSHATALKAASASQMIPLFGYSVTSSRDGNNYQGVMVGRDPNTSTTTTTVPTELVPIILNIGGVVFDPTAPDIHCLGGRVPSRVIKQSPMFSSHSFVMGGTNVGTTQYIDAFQRANFWDAVSANGGGYHTKLALQILPAFLFNVPPARGATFPADEFVGGCTAGNLGIVDINWFAPLIINQVLPRLIAEGLVSPKTFPIFMIYSVGMSIGPPGNLSKCCVGGFHSAALTSSGAIQTFSILDFDASGVFGPSGLDTAIMSHEVGEWMDDPIGNNPTPAWGHTGQVTGCQNNLEVGDPLTKTDFPNTTMPNGFTYHLQELAFFSWFYGAPSIAVNDWFSDHNTFKGDAGPVCVTKK